MADWTFLYRDEGRGPPLPLRYFGGTGSLQPIGHVSLTRPGRAEPIIIPVYTAESRDFWRGVT